MTRRERLMATLRGEAVDRPAVSFYELNGLDERPDDPDPLNIYSDPSWRPLIDLARERTDRIVMRWVPFRNAPVDPSAELTKVERSTKGGSVVTRTTIRAGARLLTSRTRRDPDVNTVWVEEHLLKDAADLEAYLALPAPTFGGEPDVSGVIDAEGALGDSGIVMIDTSDPLCDAASLFDMGAYTIVAMTEPVLFGRLLDRFASVVLPRVEAISKALPGRLWRVFGPEYASPPYLPPAMYPDYVVRYDRQMVESIRRHRGYARIHAHGNLTDVLDYIVSTGCDGLDPIEPPPQGDISLADVRRRYGDRLVLFGNLEVSDIENLPTDQFVKRVDQAIKEGTTGPGRGFVLMPSACPYGRRLSPLALANYEAIVERVGA